MNDRPDPTQPEDETPEIAEVRRLLADARHTEPMPDDVAARMHSVLDRLGDGLGDGLGDETPTARPEPSAGNVIPISVHRRRRAAALLVAAAAIVVGGVVMSQDFNRGGGSGATTAGGEAQASTATGGRSARAEGEQPERNYTANEDSPGPGTGQPRLRQGRVVVRSRHFTDDALRGRALLERSDTAAKQSLVRDCQAPTTSGGRLLAAEYQDAPAVLLFRRPQGGTQVVDLFVCGSSTPTRTTTLPAP